MKRQFLPLSCGLYRRLLAAYPADFRREYGDEMQQAFYDACRQALQSRGAAGLAGFWIHIMSDLAASVCKERFTTMDKKSTFFCLLAFALGILAGYLDFHSKEVQGPVLILLVFTFVFGFALPCRAWRWALIIGGGIPLCHIVNALLRRPPPYPVEPNLFATCLAFFPAFMGAYMGAMLRRLTQWTFTA